MAKNEARRQKQLAKKKAKREERRTQIARATSPNPLIQMAAAASWPVVVAWMPVNLWETGIGQLILARRKPDGRMACAIFLVDVFCLGVKDAFWKIMSEVELDNLVKKFDSSSELHQVEPAYLAKLVQESVEYARSFGLPPHPDYAHARMLLEGIDTSQCSETFTFGKNGKPYYFRGPFESLEKAQLIARRIQDAGGHVTIPLKANEMNAPEMLDDMDDETFQMEGPE